MAIYDLDMLLMKDKAVGKLSGLVKLHQIINVVVGLTTSSDNLREDIRSRVMIVVNVTAIRQALVAVFRTINGDLKDKVFHMNFNFGDRLDLATVSITSLSLSVNHNVGLIGSRTV